MLTFLTFIIRVRVVVNLGQVELQVEGVLLQNVATECFKSEIDHVSMASVSKIFDFILSLVSDAFTLSFEVLSLTLRGAKVLALIY